MFSNLLLDTLKKSENPRIIIVSSAAYSGGKFDPDNFQSEKGFSSFGTYSNTKLLNILFTLELAERLKDTPITVNALHPGVVNTNFASEFRGMFRVLYGIAKVFLLTPEKGAETSVYLASSEEVKNVTGKYFVRCKPAELKNAYITSANRKILWEKSLLLSGL